MRRHHNSAGRWHDGGPTRACHGKLRYGQRGARTAARQINDSQLEPVHAYPCPHCRRHHVGHTL
jgi:ribosomal protein L37AE/L43A